MRSLVSCTGPITGETTAEVSAYLTQPSALRLGYPLLRGRSPQIMAAEVANAIAKVQEVQAELESSRRGKTMDGLASEEALLLSPSVRRQLIRGHNATQAATKQVHSPSYSSSALRGACPAGLPPRWGLC